MHTLYMFITGHSASHLLSLSGTVEITTFVFLQSKEEVMAVRLREADNIAAMAELQQHISELEIQVTLSVCL